MNIWLSARLSYHNSLMFTSPWWNRLPRTRYVHLFRVRDCGGDRKSLMTSSPRLPSGMLDGPNCSSRTMPRRGIGRMRSFSSKKTRPWRKPQPLWKNWLVGLPVGWCVSACVCAFFPCFSTEELPWQPKRCFACGIRIAQSVKIRWGNGDGHCGSQD